MRVPAKDIPFRILKGWRISLVNNSPYKAQSCVNEVERRATIYGWPKDSSEPSDFMFHEFLHIALSALAKIYADGRAVHRYERYKKVQEELIQDICAVSHPQN
jgi:hypothetical protein